MDIIKAENITKRFTNHVALDDVSVSIPEGSIYGLLGLTGRENHSHKNNQPHNCSRQRNCDLQRTPAHG